MITISEALELCATAFPPRPVVRRRIDEADGRVLSSPVHARLSLPSFRSSSMDGYALRAVDTVGAREGEPIRLRLIGEVAAGLQGGLEDLPEIGPGQAVRIFTGGAVPPGADAVVRQEITRIEDDALLLDDAVERGNNVREIGEELTEGTPLLEAGERLNPGRIAAVTSAGASEVEVYSAPRITVVVTGDEVRRLGSDLPLGGVYDAGGPLMSTLMRRWGYGTIRVRYARDDRAVLREVLDKAIRESDVVVTSGGVSVGDRDLVIPVSRSLGVEEVFWRVRQKPGKPLFLGRAPSGTALLGLPGNPGAMFVGALVYLRTLLNALEGMTDPRPQFRQGRLAEDVPRTAQRDCWIRGRWETDDAGGVVLSDMGHQASHMLSNLCRADALFRLPAGEGPMPTGSIVDWVPIR